MRKAIKITESELYNIIKESVKKVLVNENNFKNDNRNNTHYAIHKPTGKIVFAWDYKGYDPEDLKTDKKYYFLDDLKDTVCVNPKECTILTRNTCIKRGIDPRNNASWVNNDELRNLYFESSVIRKKKLNEGYYGNESVEIELRDIEIKNPKLDEYLMENEWLLDYTITIEMDFDEVPYEEDTNYGGYAELSDYEIYLDDKIKNNIPQEFISGLMDDIRSYIEENSELWGEDSYNNFNDDSYWEDDRYDEWRERREY